MTSVSILGSTGSVGVSTLDVIRAAGGDYSVAALAAGCNVERLAAQAKAFRPDFVAIADESLLTPLREALSGLPIETGAGETALIEAAGRGDAVVAAIVGAAGLKPSLAAARRGARLAIANKECLVSAGALFTGAVKQSGGEMLPVDSEHSAVFQLLEGRKPDTVRKVTLTASGGPFRTWPREKILAAAPEDALRHPTWEMGAKITIDSATLMNKGLELIEASVLFGIGDDQLDVLVHPQSIVHALVEFTDGAVLSHMGAPDMKGPIAYALSWPARIADITPPLDLAEIGSLTFESPDPSRFPALELARAALRQGGHAPAALNAANEVAVASFLDRRIGFPDISSVVQRVLDNLSAGQDLNASGMTLESVLEIDARARSAASGIIAARAA